MITVRYIFIESFQNTICDMENKSDRKVDITKKILEIEDDSILDRLEDILAGTETVAFTTSGKPLNREEYKTRIEKISEDVKSGGERYTTEEVQDYVTKRKS